MKKLGMIIMTFVLAVACIKNDLSYPRVVAQITSFTVDGQKSVTIDAANNTVVVELEETADMSALKVTSFAYTEAAELLTPLPETVDLTSPVTLTFKTYQEYSWTISAVQPIERYIEVENQVGDAQFDVANRMAYVYVDEDQMLEKVVFDDMKLEPEGSEVLYTVGQVSVDGVSVEETKECHFPMTLDCVIQRSFYVGNQGDTLKWNVKVLHKVIELAVESVNAWCYSAEVCAASKGGEASVIEYKTASASSWTQASEISVDGTSVTAQLSRLKADTQYVVRVWNGEQVSEEYSFKTDTPAQLANMGFDEWSDVEGCWYPYPAGTANPVWGTANPGTKLLNKNVTTPEYSHVVSGAAVRMESIDALIKFAAGNLFTGYFDALKGTTATLYWGTPFTSRPYSLKGWYDYAPKIIDYAPETVKGVGANPYLDQLGKTDHCQILAVLIDEAENDGEKGPFFVTSDKPGVPDLRNDPRVIAFGTIESDVDTQGQYVEFECVLEYKDDRTPDYVIVVACSSLYGNYFTGAVGSVMYVDEFEFIYK